MSPHSEVPVNIHFHLMLILKEQWRLDLHVNFRKRTSRKKPVQNMCCSEICYTLEHPKNNVGSLQHGEKWTRGASSCRLGFQAKSTLAGAALLA
jgi:hypothetical protein